MEALKYEFSEIISPSVIFITVKVIILESFYYVKITHIQKLQCQNIYAIKIFIKVRGKFELL